MKDIRNKAKEKGLMENEKKQLTEEEREYKSKRKLVQEKLIKFATRIPAFMYLIDFRENTLQDVITRLEPDLFLTVTGLPVRREAVAQLQKELRCCIRSSAIKRHDCALPFS